VRYVVTSPPLPAARVPRGRADGEQQLRWIPALAVEHAPFPRSSNVERNSTGLFGQLASLAARMVNLDEGSGAVL
jgi:hypothetical protein